MARMKALVRHLGNVVIPIVCSNSVAGTDWIRTSVDVPERSAAGAKVTAFDLEQIDQPRGVLDEIVPVADEVGGTLAMHPDDPSLLGNDRIMYDVAWFKRVGPVPSPANAIGFRQGIFSEMGIVIPATIRRLGRHIAYVHFRDVRGTADSFTET
jgi:mannonate dehydratase